MTDKIALSKRIHIKPAWSFYDEKGEYVDPRLFVLLSAIHNSGKLTIAATELGMSYRHVWNVLKKWTEFFGSDLVALKKGRGALLTPLGEKLLWAEQRAQARFEPQLISIASELNLEIQKHLMVKEPLLKIAASYGYAIALLPNFTNKFKLDLQYRSYEESFDALSKGECNIAAFHLPTDIVSQRLIDIYSKYFKANTYKVIRFVTRKQGLIVQKDNPKNITKMTDLQKSGIKFINRQKHSGTRLLIDELLARSSIDSKSVIGFDRFEFTHSAIAAYVASGMADVGIGIETAARQFGLDFIPLTTEHYVLVCHHKTLKELSVQRLIKEIKSDKFHEEVSRLAGYESTSCGDIDDLEEMIPWDI
ncbi:substrate-binding domain-containing protein [Colwellia sp. 20A7]|uniref:helix-turn-helix transcriptional regulator n=1 Tax=Colwellia sp. 20A7 TaxID=2689569 RepID=UPI001358B741|nr:substrate-binding domain-containing protein [Colwellia sp. 20A7]